MENPAQDVAMGLLYLLPSECANLDEDTTGLPTELAKAIQIYERDLPHPLLIETEYALWRVKWKVHADQQLELPKKLVDAPTVHEKMSIENAKAMALNRKSF